MARPMTAAGWRAEVTAVECAKCGAEPGHACRSLSGGFADEPHPARVLRSGVGVERPPAARPLSAAPAAGRSRSRGAKSVLRDDAHSPLAVHLTDGAAVQIISELVRADGKLETGGLLAGLFHGDTLVVTDVGTPGPKAKRTKGAIKHDRRHNAGLALKLARESGGRVREVGAWHSHPSGSLTPSFADLNAAASMHRALAEIDGPLAGFCDLILAPDYLGDWRKPRIAAFVTRRDGRAFTTEPASLRGAGL